MKSVITVLATLLLSSTAFAGAWSLECSSKDKSIMIDKFEFSSAKLGVKKGDFQNEGTQYLTDSRSSLNDSDPQSVLKAAKKVYIEMPYEVNGQENKKIVTLDKDFKTSCGDSGHITKFNQIVRVLNMNGKEIVPPTRIYCRDRFEGGHCVGEGSY